MVQNKDDLFWVSFWGVLSGFWVITVGRDKQRGSYIQSLINCTPSLGCLWLRSKRMPKVYFFWSQSKKIVCIENMADTFSEKFTRGAKVYGLLECAFSGADLLPYLTMQENYPKRTKTPWNVYLSAKVVEARKNGGPKNKNHLLTRNCASRCLHQLMLQLENIKCMWKRRPRSWDCRDTNTRKKCTLYLILGVKVRERVVDSQLVFYLPLALFCLSVRLCVPQN